MLLLVGDLNASKELPKETIVLHKFLYFKQATALQTMVFAVFTLEDTS